MSKILFFSAAFAAGTFFIGWWSVPLIAVVWGGLRSMRNKPVAAWGAGLMAAVVWAILVTGTSQAAPLLSLAGRLGGVFGIPGWATVGATVAYAFLLAWSAAKLAGGLVGKRVSI